MPYTNVLDRRHCRVERRIGFFFFFIASTTRDGGVLQYTMNFQKKIPTVGEIYFFLIKRPDENYLTGAQSFRGYSKNKEAAKPGEITGRKGGFFFSLREKA